MMTETVQKLDVTIDENEICEGAAIILEAIRPEWEQGRIVMKMLTDGITNKLVRCKLEGANEDETVLVRVYGNKTDLLIDRKAETRNIILLNIVGLAPRIYATFNNGLSYEFVPGCTLNGETVIKPEIFRLVARKMSDMHRITIQGDCNPEPMLWKKLDDFLNLVPDKFTDDNKHKRFEKLVPSKIKIKEELVQLKEKLVGLNSPVVFCHNDLLLGNVIYTEDRNTVTFIDYEYAAFNYQAFDIGNHFSEFSGVDNVDYTKYPNKETQVKWLREYLSSNNNATDEDIETLYVQVNQFALASHMLWGIWALIQAEHSYIDFDFIEYSAIRFNEYFARKDQFLALELPR